MFRFANTDMLYLLIVVAALVAMYIIVYYRKMRNLRRFGDEELMAKIMPEMSKVRQHIKFGLCVLALVLLIFAVARPQFGSKKEMSKTKGIEAMFVLDVSNSMRATDVSPTRLDNAKRMLSKLTDNMANDKIGLIIFAGDAYVQMPISSDNVSAKMFLQTINPGSVPIPGTAIGTALDMAVKSFGEANENIGRTIILLTDGENHEDDAVAAAKLAEESGITVNVVGFGLPSGSPIPVKGGADFWRDGSGNVVVTKLNEDMCREVASAGNGVYVRATNSNRALRTLMGEIDKMQKGEMDVTSFSNYDEKFYVLAWLALVLLVAEFFVLGRKNGRLSKIKLFEK